MQELMIDFETLGTGPDAVVISLGACFFDLDGQKIGPTFYMAFDIEDQLQKSRAITADTLRWWMNQSDAAKKVFHEKAKPTKVVLETFVTWVKSNSQKSKIKPWGNGATFDISIIEHLFQQYGLECPWLFYNVMDVRTFRRFIANNEKIQKGGVNHNALDDAISQTKFLLEHYQFYKNMLRVYVDLAKTNQNFDIGSGDLVLQEISSDRE